VKLVTGANGFLGRAVATALRENGIPVRSAVRLSNQKDDEAIGDIGSDTNWRTALEGVDTIVHTAARVHIMNDPALDP
jgi:nucleoside-diphosphate-sugar epimerase